MTSNLKSNCYFYCNLERFRCLQGNTRVIFREGESRASDLCRVHSLRKLYLKLRTMWHGELSLAIGEGCGSKVGASWHFLSDQGTWETASLLDLNGRAFAIDAAAGTCSSLKSAENRFTFFLSLLLSLVIPKAETNQELLLLGCAVFRSSTFIVPTPLSGGHWCHLCRSHEQRATL